MRKIVVLLCIVVVIGCARDQAQNISRGSHGAAGILTPVILAPPSNPVPTVAGQTDFKPNTAFREYAAKKLGVTSAEIEGGAIDAATARTMPNSIGNAWAFTMWLKSDRHREVRGWATPGGDVIAPDQNLGMLFVEAGVWRKKRNQRQNYKLANNLATLIVWSYGMGHMVYQTFESDGDVNLPSLELNAKGDGKLRFISKLLPGGETAGYGPGTYTDNVIALTRDHKATLTKAPYNR